MYYLVEGPNLLLLEFSPFFATGPDNRPLIVVSFEHQYAGFLFVEAEHFLEDSHNEPHAVYFIIQKDDVIRGKRFVFHPRIDFGMQYTGHLWLRFQK
jgi:hypothetical protein